MKLKLTSILFLSLLLNFAACKKDSLRPFETGRVNVHLTDTSVPSAGNFDEINIDLQKVEIKTGGSTGGDWYTLSTKSGMYNLLHLSGGLDTLIASANLPTGETTQIRINLGNGNTVKKDGVLYPLILLPEDKNKLTIEINKIIDKSAIGIHLDFNAEQSVTMGSGGYYLKPVITVLRNNNP